ncbi:alanine racemase [Hydrogenophilus islandicus]
MRPARATVDLAALIANYRWLQAQGKPGRTLAVVKANAYGHGAIPCAQALAPFADGCAVAFLDEAVALRDAGITAPILLLEGCLTADEYAEVAHHRLWSVLHGDHQLAWLEAAHQRGTPSPEQLWIKVDSGMHRLGFAPEALARVVERLVRIDYPPERIVWMTHLACADEPGHPHTRAQIAAFRHAIATLPEPFRSRPVSVANSAALIAWPEAQGVWARPGIALYGANPFAHLPKPVALRPVMTLTSALIATRWIDAGEAVGYGAAFVAPRRSRIGVVALGYGDGYPRSAPTGTPVAVAGYRTRLVGRVSMDLLTVDLTDLPESVGLGASVELWGAQIAVDEVAKAAGTIGYELLCHLRRVPLCYVS